MLTLGRTGLRAGLAACAATIAFDLVQLLQIVGAVHFPWDEILIFGTSLCIIVPFLLEILAFHYTTTPARRFWSHAALIFSTIYAVFAAANYVIQLTTVIPAKLHGAADSIRLLEQTPHSLLWDFDAIAYVTMGLATLMIIPALGSSSLERRVRTACAAHVVSTVFAGIVYFYPDYSYRLLLLGLPWAVTPPAFMFALGYAIRARDLGSGPSI